MQVSQIFKCFGDDKTMKLFKHITGHGDKPTTTPKQYYSRMERLMKMGLIDRVTPGQYAITNLGKVMEHMINTTERALDIKGRLFTLDALQLANRREKIKDLTTEQWDELIGNIIKDETIKNIIFDTKKEFTN